MLARLTKRQHEKPRNGCINCWLRRVKCNEEKPQCANCIRFSLCCDLGPAFTAGVQPMSVPDPKATTSTGAGAGAIPRKRRGRPRKDWASLLPVVPLPPVSSTGENTRGRKETETLTETPRTEISSPLPQTLPHSYSDRLTLNHFEASVLNHFISSTGPSLGNDLNDPYGHAWARLGPRIAFTYEYVLHLILSLGAYHMVHSGVTMLQQKLSYASFAKQHVTSGLAKLTTALLTMDESTCGPIYLATILATYCTLAAGPSCDNELLMCIVGNDLRGKPMPPVFHGSRVVRRRYGKSVIFRGLTADFDPTIEKTFKPTCECEGFPRLDWVEPFQRLKELVSSDNNMPIYMSALTGIQLVYEATFGGPEGSYDGPEEHKLVLRWPYLMRSEFVALLVAQDSIALLILAHWALTLKMSRFWFLDGWADHMLLRIDHFTNGRYRDWLPYTADSSEMQVRLSRTG
ncbi:hypothetical protein IWW34DRAFT_231614 [Fusarium oxysporum f. sp. albedinis]|nr:hypothetical protein IWW34DRAFT_231614 [Fusarium oxysporum f. sp. albedinis]